MTIIKNSNRKPEVQSMNAYEAMFMVKPNLDKEAREKALEAIKETISKHGGTVKELNEMGKKRLTYTIKKHRDADYLLVNFETAPDAIDKMKKEYALDENVLRAQIFRS